MIATVGQLRGGVVLFVAAAVRRRQLSGGRFQAAGCLQTGWSINVHMKMGGGWWTHRCRSLFAVHLIVDQTPLLEKRVHSHDRAHITGQIATTGGHRQVLGRV